MKKLIVVALTGICAVSVFAQGTIIFNNFQASIKTLVYAPLSSNPSFHQIGQGSSDTPAGTTVWTGFSTVGLAGTTGQYGGSATLSSLLAAPGLNAAESSLLPATANAVTSFHTGSTLLGGGRVVGVTSTFANLSQDSTGGATLEMVAWDNSSGQYSTWALGSVAWKAGLIAGGVSGTANMTATIGGTQAAAPILPTTMQSFNLYMVPEPSTFALAGLGAAALLIFRRRK